MFLKIPAEFLLKYTTIIAWVAVRIGLCTRSQRRYSRACAMMSGWHKSGRQRCALMAEGSVTLA